MVIRFKRSAHNLGYSYKAGAVTTSLPLKDSKFLVEIGIAEEIEQEKKERPEKAEVKTATVKKAEKSVVRKSVKK